MELVEAASPVFGRHGTFSPRYGWLKTAYDQVSANPLAFSHDDAPTKMGVGKNMVDSIKFWGEATKIITRANSTKNKSIYPTLWGETFLADDGLDPYLEDPGTLWILHWLLSAPTSLAPVWWLTFNTFPAVEFTQEQLETYIVNQIGQIREWEKAKDGSLAPFKQKSEKTVIKDVAQLLHMYGVEQRGNAPLEDVFNSPFRQLQIIQKSEFSGIPRFVTGRKPGLTPQIIAFIVFDYLSRVKNTSVSNIAMHVLAGRAGGPGNTLKLSRDDLTDSLMQVSSEKTFQVQDSASGIQQLYWKGDPETNARNLLEDYYNKKLSEDFVPGFAADLAVNDHERAA